MSAYKVLAMCPMCEERKYLNKEGICKDCNDGLYEKRIDDDTEYYFQLEQEEYYGNEVDGYY